MMILCKLKLENFKRYKTFELDFDEGLVGIIGKNGSGKSTIFEAILFALYGEFKDRGYKDIVRNANATDKDAVVVELNFEFDSIEYKVVREFRGKALSANAKLYKNGELITSGAKEVTTSIMKLTKMSKEAFLHTLFASQKELTSLSNSKPEDRKRMIRKLLGLEKIDYIEKELIEKSRELKREISAFAEVLLSTEDIQTKKEQIKANEAIKKTLNEELQTQSKQIDSLKLKELDIKKELDLFAKTKEAKQKALSELNLLKNSINSNIENQNKLSTELKDLEEKQLQYKALEPIKKEYETLQSNLKEQIQLKEYSLKKEGLIKEQVQLREQYKKAKNDIALLQKECEGFDSLRQKEQETKTQQEQIKQTLTQIQAKEKELNSNIFAEQRVINDTTAKIQQIQALGKESNCPTCTRPLLEEYDNVIDSLNSTINEIQTNKITKLNKQLQEVETNKKTIETQKEQIDKNLSELNSQLALINSKQKDLQNLSSHLNNVEQKGKENNDEIAKLDKYSYDENKHKTLENSFNEILPKYEQMKSLETMLKRYDSVKQDLENISKKITEQNSTYDTKELDYKQIVYDETAHIAKEKEYEEHHQTYELKVTQLNEIKVKIAQCEGEIKTIQSNLDNNEIQEKKVQTKKDDLIDYDKIKLSLSEFKTKLNSKVAPRISDIASNMYAQITKGKYQHIEVSNDFDFYIYDEGKKYPIERFSGGEIDLANLVLRIAISKTLSELSGSSQIGFLAFDEVFGSQDEARRMEILEAFHMIKEQYRQIFLISHELEIKEMFEHIVEL
ncbi:SMC family ATPase [Arcobacter sp. KX21116]|uniref:AAA family ATPase n=1 Tax=Arcobacter iocasae TaxID=2906515 RepID=UPI0035D433F2